MEEIDNNTGQVLNSHYTTVRKELSTMHWIFFYHNADQDELKQSMNLLINALDKDLRHALSY